MWNKKDKVILGLLGCFFLYSMGIVGLKGFAATNYGLAIKHDNESKISKLEGKLEESQKHREMARYFGKNGDWLKDFSDRANIFPYLRF